MATPKYREYFDLMLKQHKELFDSFKKVHDNFAADPNKWKKEFNEMGREVQDVIRIYENRLCNHSENSGYSRYSANLAEKFQYEIKRYLPKIDYIGMD